MCWNQDMLQQSVNGCLGHVAAGRGHGLVKVAGSPLKKQGCQVIAKENVKFLSSLSVLWKLFFLFPTI